MDNNVSRPDSNVLWIPRGSKEIHDLIEAGKLIIVDDQWYEMNKGSGSVEMTTNSEVDHDGSGYICMVGPLAKPGYKKELSDFMTKISES